MLRDDRLVNLRSDSVKRQLVFNQETEMSEFIYDIKLYQIVQVQDNVLISYALEIFSLNEADVFYLYNYPMMRST